MTFREKLEKEYPNKDITAVIANDCPSSYGYELYTPRCPTGREQDCSVCWNREIPEEKTIADAIQEGLANPDERIVSAFKEMGETASKTMEALRSVPKILDSGNRRQFESGAVRDIQEGKGRCDLLPLDVVAEMIGDNPNKPDPVILYISKFQLDGDIYHLYEALEVFTDRHFTGETLSKSWYNMILQVAIHFEEGAKKYGENNWQKGIPVRCYIDSAVRHYLKFLRGDKDEPHDRAFCWNILCAIWTCKHKPELNEYGKNQKTD